MSSGALEFDQAIGSLEKAYGIDPHNKDVRRLLQELKEQKAKQKKLDRETFSGMFNRGQVYEEDQSPASPREDHLDDAAAREQKFRKEVRTMFAGRHASVKLILQCHAAQRGRSARSHVREQGAT